MTLEQAINNDKNWKEFLKKMVDNCNNYSDYQKEFLKILLDMYYEGRKNTLIQNDIQAKLIESIINGNNSNNNH